MIPSTPKIKPPANTPTRADASVISQSSYGMAPAGYATITSNALTKRTNSQTSTTGGI